MLGVKSKSPGTAPAPAQHQHHHANTGPGYLFAVFFKIKNNPKLNNGIIN
jgi:hypothetical protein